MIKSTSAKLSDAELMEVLESLRTRPGMMLKKRKSSGGPPVLTPGELRQMLEDTHVTKVRVEYKTKRSFRRKTRLWSFKHLLISLEYIFRPCLVQFVELFVFKS